MSFQTASSQLTQDLSLRCKETREASQHILREWKESNVFSLRISCKIENTSKALKHFGRNLSESMKCAIRYNIHLLPTTLWGVFLYSCNLHTPVNQRLKRGARTPSINSDFLPSGCRTEQEAAKQLWFLLCSESLHTAFCGMVFEVVHRKCQPLQAG